MVPVSFRSLDSIHIWSIFGELHLIRIRASLYLPGLHNGPWVFFFFEIVVYGV